MSNKPTYKTTRKYKCPYCDYKGQRSDLISHVERKHPDLIPQGYSAARVVYNSINKTDHGTCMICKKPTYEWNPNISRYANLCRDPKCRAEVRRIALERHLRVYNKPTLLNDPEQQEKMLANRRISGSYKFSDGGAVTYTGQYEKKTLEFMDKVLNIPSADIQAPGPVLEYEYNGEVHKWITDIYYIPANLLIEVKDGGSNPNNRSMVSYREKQVAKETMITALGKFNYLRLTNNDFSQLLDILADMKYGALEDDNSMKIHINEAAAVAAAIPPSTPSEAYVVPYGMNNSFLGWGYRKELDAYVLVPSKDGKLTKVDEDKFESDYDIGPYIHFPNDSEEIQKKIEEAYTNQDNVGPNFVVEVFLGHGIIKPEEALLCEGATYFDKDREADTLNLIENGITNGMYSTKGYLLQYGSDNGISIYRDIRDGKWSAAIDNGMRMATTSMTSESALKSSNQYSLLREIAKGGSNNG